MQADGVCSFRVLCKAFSKRPLGAPPAALSWKTMASYSTNEFRSGLKILLDNDPCAIIENEFVKPGKGQGLEGHRGSPPTVQGE